MTSGFELSDLPRLRISTTVVLRSASSELSLCPAKKSDRGSQRQLARFEILGLQVLPGCWMISIQCVRIIGQTAPVSRIDGMRQV